jgi:hypothetical protein
MEVVVRELGPFLFQQALGDVPVAFDFECGHVCNFWFWFGVLTVTGTVKNVSAWNSVTGGQIGNKSVLPHRCNARPVQESQRAAMAKACGYKQMIIARVSDCS